MLVQKTISLLVITVCLYISPVVFARVPSPFTTAIKPAPNATHIAAITKDTIVVIAGSTYRFTVDTPEDQGLVSTRPTVAQFLLQISSQDGSRQQYHITDKAGNTKNEGDIISGDRLLVTSQNGKATKIYQLGVRPMALSSQLVLQRKQITVNTTNDLTLYFTAGQRSPDATVKIYLPPGIHATMQNTTVNVIG